MFLPQTQVGSQRICAFNVQRNTTTENMAREVQHLKSFYLFANLSDVSDCVQGEELGKQDPGAEVQEFLRVVIWNPLVVPGKQDTKKQHGVCWKQCSNSAVVCAAVQMISGLGLESARIQCKCHKQFRNRDACCTWFVFPIFKSPLQLDFQNTFIILMVWWKYCLPDLCKNWLQERLILGYKGTTSFP